MLETSRLLLRPLTVHDAAEFHALNADPEVLRYTGDDPFADVAAARRFLASYDLTARTGLGRFAVVRRDGVWLGWCGVNPDGGMAAPDLGFRFHRRFWGQGYATEAARASLAHAFTLGLERVEARAMVENVGSWRVLEKVGMRRIGETTCAGRRSHHYVAP